MKYLIGLFVVALSGCAQYTPPAAIATPSGYTVNRCLHFDECAGRPYPVAAIPWKAIDEGLGLGSGDGK